ncbi:MAG: pyruvate kinase [Verrucomicrobium sp.]|nr:pyruvate kinase [Verrucomicrobium sp.]
MRRTKIIATLGPVSESPERLRQLMQAGVNIFRINMSHAKYDTVRRVTKDIRAISAELGLHVGLLLDTQGPEIRTGELAEKITLKAGDKFAFTVRGAKAEGLHVSINYDDFIDDISIGDVVLVDSGVIRMKALSKEKDVLHCEVLTPGVMSSRRHVNLPGVKVNLPALTTKDLNDIDLGLECGIDYIALSFVREANDVQTLRQLLTTKGAERVRIISKVEDHQAVKNLNEIIEASDGVMVARGDLGIEVPYEELPIIQRRIVKACIQQFKTVIVATHMLESMIQNPMPTRAEITDVANAVFEQADSVMLSGESTVGAYPLECVEVLNRIAERTERSGGAGYPDGIVPTTDSQRVVSAAVRLADAAGATAICVFTRTGMLAANTASMRPKCSLIYAFTPEEGVCRSLTLNYAVRPFQLPFPEAPQDTVIAAEKLLRTRNLVKPGDKLVFVTDMQIQGQRVDSVQLHIIK